MKRIGIVLAIIVTLALVAGCASSGGSSGGNAAKSGGTAAALKPYSVDLKTLPFVKNAKPFTRKYDDLIIPFPEFPVDVTQYTRVTITCKYFDAAGEEIEQSDTKAMVSFLYDGRSRDRGPDMGPGGNAPLKELNVGGYSGLVNKDRGVRVSLKKAPEVIILQNCDDVVKFIELTSIVFHTKSASGE
jgi:hypothetical protein